MTTSTDTDKSIGSTQRVLDAVQELTALEQTASRETVQELTGLTMTVVDDRLKVLTDDHKLRRLVKGVYVLATPYPPARPITCTQIADGYVTLEIGDKVLVLTPKEARATGRALAGFAGEAQVAESVRHHLMLATSLAAQVEVLSRQMRALREKQDHEQMPLALGEGNAA
jgi:hypothetical protein